MKQIRTAVSITLTALLLAPLSSCAATEGDVTVLRVFAVPSMSVTLAAAAARFEDAHPGAHVEFRFGRGASLARQIGHGESADVFVASTPQSLDGLEGQETILTPTFFATNRAVIVVGRGNPYAITTLRNLSRRVKVAVCPRGQHDACGDLAHYALRQMRTRVRPTALDEQDVIAQVMQGRADAGIVYATDVRAVGRSVDAVELPPRYAIGSSYGVATLTKSEHPRLARDFAEMLTSPATRSSLSAAGFGAPQKMG